MSAQFPGKEKAKQEFHNKDYNQTFSGIYNSVNLEIRQNEPFKVSKTMVDRELEMNTGSI